MSFEIDLNFLEFQWEKQKGKCYYTNVDMLYIARVKSPFQVSIDRKDSNKGYTKENTVLCCQSINFMKNDYPLESFMSFLKKVKQN